MMLLLNHLPLHTGMAYVYIQHLSPDLESNLAEVFSRATKMPVVEAREGVRPLPDHLYIIPPNRTLLISKKGFHLSLRPVRPKVHLPINDFFVSLSELYQERAIGVLLSGNAPDGAQG